MSKTYEERREEQRKYQGDVWYEVWRSGRDPDMIDHDRVSRNYYDGMDYQDAARVELRHQRPPEPEFEYPESE